MKTEKITISKPLFEQLLNIATLEMKVYTITFTVETEPEALAKAIKKRFADVVLAYDTNGPFEIKDGTFDDEHRG